MAAGSALKTDSYVVETNVHFPTDYNLLWDCVRKCIDMVGKVLEKYPELPWVEKKGRLAHENKKWKSSNRPDQR